MPYRGRRYLHPLDRSCQPASPIHLRRGGQAEPVPYRTRPVGGGRFRLLFGLPIIFLEDYSFRDGSQTGDRARAEAAVPERKD